eukprot:gene38327-50306_t
MAASIPSMADKQPANNLAEQVMARLSADIRGGRLAPGARLPTEQELTTEFGVSRTVVREAVAAYDSDQLRQAIAKKGAIAVIPNNPSRSIKHPLDKHLYAQRHLVECCFSKLKQFRRVATRFEKTAKNYLAVVTIAAIVLWLRMASEKNQNLQDTFLNYVRKNKVPLTIFLVNGVKLQGVVTWFDNFCVLLRRDGHSQLVYKHAISTIMPGGPLQFLDRKADPERTIAVQTRTLVVGPYRVKLRKGVGEMPASRLAQARLEEAVDLAAAIDLTVVTSLIATTDMPRPATYLGKGKVADLTALIAEQDIGLAVIDTALSPVQQRNLEKAFGIKVIDRTGLILEIFGRRARTREGTLQVELAHLGYQKSRLVRSWTHLERQRGGFGFMGGPGETQIETDRRLIQERITKLERALADVKRTRGLHRAGRERVPYPTVALVGYTNAGKSTLFNRLAKAEVLAKDMLFATLDPTARVIKLKPGLDVILSDT